VGHWRFDGGNFIRKMANFARAEAWPLGEFAGKPFSGAGLGLFSSFSWKITIVHPYKVKHWQAIRTIT
jgi:hypothetical protein